MTAERSVPRGPIDARRESEPRIVPLGRWRLPALGLVLTILATSLIAPLGVLGYWAFRGFVQGSTRQNALVSDPLSLVGPTASTTLVSVVAAVVGAGVILPIAIYTTRYRGRFGGLVNAVVLSGFAVPGLVVALALVFWTLNSAVLVGIYQTLPLLIAAYVLHFGALALGTSQVAVAGVPAPLLDAARALGTNRLVRFARIELPLMAPGLLAGAGLILLSTMKELPATLLLAPPGFSTLATNIWGSAEEALWADAALASIVLVAASAVLTWLLIIRRRGAFA